MSSANRGVNGVTRRIAPVASIALWTLLMLAYPHAVRAQQQQPQPAAPTVETPENAVFATRADAVRLDVLVTRGDRPVVNLTAADFEVRDNDKPQPVRLIAQGDMPIDIVLALDVSGSMTGGPLDQLVAGVRALSEELRPGDRLGVITFSHELRMPIPLGADAGAIRDLLTRVAARGATSLNDAALAALLSGDPGARTVIILFSDGADRTSWLPDEQVLAAARRLDSVVYGVVLDSSASTGDKPLRDARGVTLRLPNVIDALTQDTAGRILTTRDAGRLAGVFRQIFSEFRQRYVLAFEPAPDAAPGWHPLRVRVTSGRADVSVRAGYFAAPR